MAVHLSPLPSIISCNTRISQTATNGNADNKTITDIDTLHIGGGGILTPAENPAITDNSITFNNNTQSFLINDEPSWISIFEFFRGVSPQYTWAAQSS